jgi:hypothetical protein
VVVLVVEVATNLVNRAQGAGNLWSHLREDIQMNV